MTAKKSSHTPVGETWTSADQEGGPGYCDMAQVFGPDGKTLAFIEPTNPADRANAIARLVAAAPDLLAAANAAEKLIGLMPAGSPGQAVWEQLRAALAKASRK